MQGESEHTERVRYRIDARATIVGVGGAWERFATANGAQALGGREPIGKPLWRFVAGADTRYLYELLFARVCALDAPIEIPFRCDAPDRRRFMVLRVAPAGDGALDLDASVRRVEDRPAVWLLDGHVARSNLVLRICSFCKRIDCGSPGWLEVEDAVSRLGLLVAVRAPMLSHAVCRDCRHRVEEIVASARGTAGG